MIAKRAPDKQWLIRYAAYTHLAEQIAQSPSAWTSIFACIYTRYVADIEQFAAGNGWTLSRIYNGTPRHTFTAVHCCVCLDRPPRGVPAPLRQLPGL